MRGRALTAGLAAALLLAGHAGPALAAPATFVTGFTDPLYLSSPDPAPWMARTRATGAQLVLLPVFWQRVAPHAPPAPSNPADPANPAYDFSALDLAVRDAAAQGLTVALDVAAEGGPAWADGPGRPQTAAPGTWKPSATAYGAFATALASRYSGSFDPGGGALPHVSLYEAWNEPNLSTYLTPQWSGRRPASPAVYRGLLDALYVAVKSVSAANRVIAGGTAPFGDPPGGRRMSPLTFTRELLCLRGAALRSEPCPQPARFDVYAHHPYEIAGPYLRAFGRDDVTLPDLHKLAAPLRAAERRGSALPAGRKPLWVTEFSWDSSPPDPHGIPLATRAQWIDEAFYELWQQGVSALTWYLIADQPPVPSYSATYQSGMYFDDGRVKPDLAAFRFPFLAVAAAGGRTTIWGVAPTAGTVTVEGRTAHAAAGRWKPLATFALAAHQVFTRTLAIAAPTRLRAITPSEQSLEVRVG